MYIVNGILFRGCLQLAQLHIFFFSFSATNALHSCIFLFSLRDGCEKEASLRHPFCLVRPKTWFAVSSI